MNSEEFKKVVEGCIDNIRKVLDSKSQEYSSKDDKLHNFVEAAKIMRCKTKEFALLGMLNKHLVSIIDMVEKYEKYGILPDENMVEEKIGDSINYHILLKACFLDDIYNKKDKSKNPRKQLVVNAMKKRLQTILDYCVCWNRKAYLKFQEVFVREQDKEDSVADDDFVNKIIELLDKTVIHEACINVVEERKKLIKELDKEIHSTFVQKVKDEFK